MEPSHGDVGKDAYVGISTPVALEKSASKVGPGSVPSRVTYDTRVGASVVRANFRFCALVAPLNLNCCCVAPARTSPLKRIYYIHRCWRKKQIAYGLRS